MFEIASLLFKIHRTPSVLCTNILNLKNGPLLLNGICLQNLNISPSRTTIIVKRRYPVSLYKQHNRPRLQKKTLHYIVEENTELKPDALTDIVLTSYIAGVGNPGDIVSMKRSKAYYNFLLPGLAVYPTRENLEYAKSLKSDEAIQKKQLSPSVELCIKYLERRLFSIVMNKETEWTIEPWHVRASFRKAGVIIMSDSCIELPKQPIRGPNMDLEGKEFSVVITINKNHQVKARCSIHHWSTDLADRLPYVQDFWLNPGEKVFPEDSKNNTD